MVQKLPAIAARKGAIAVVLALGTVLAYGGGGTAQAATSSRNTSAPKTASPLKASPSSAPRFSLATVGPYGGEPSIATNGKGELYDITPSGGTLL